MSVVTIELQNGDRCDFEANVQHENTMTFSMPSTTEYLIGIFNKAKMSDNKYLINFAYLITYGDLLFDHKNNMLYTITKKTIDCNSPARFFKLDFVPYVEEQQSVYIENNFGSININFENYTINNLYSAIQELPSNQQDLAIELAELLERPILKQSSLAKFKYLLKSNTDFAGIAISIILAFLVNR